jgi:hypothetical protein
MIYNIIIACILIISVINHYLHLSIRKKMQHEINILLTKIVRHNKESKCISIDID